MFVGRLSSAIQKNDWDVVYDMSRSSTAWFHGLHLAVWFTNIAMIHLFDKRIGKSLKVTCTEFVQGAICGDRFQSTVILYRLGYMIYRRHQYLCIASTSNPQFLDWIMPLLEPDIPAPIFRAVDILNLNSDTEWLSRTSRIPMEMIRHMVYRNWALGFLDQETFILMKKALSVTHLNRFPDDLLHEICHYMFTCFPPAPVSQ